MVKMWRHETTEGSYVDARIKDLRPFRAIPLGAGESLVGRFPGGVSVLVESARGPSDYFTAGPMRLVSDKLKKIFADAEVNAEYFPVSVQHKAKELAEFWCLNLLETVDCLDWETSKFLPEKGFARKITKLALQMNAIQNQPLFRIGRTIPVLVAASEDLASKVRQANCSGIVLKSPEEWTNPDLTVKP